MRLAGFNSNNGAVHLNVYDLNEMNETLFQFGLGMFHSGVQLNGKEYTFGSQGGIFSHSPRAVPTAKFRESIPMGEFKGTSRDLDRILDELRIRFSGDSYDVLQNNCNSFADALVQMLCNHQIPAYVNRMANVGSFFSCLLPPSITSGAPVDSGNDNSSSSSNSASSTAISRPGISANNTAKTSGGLKPFSGQGHKLGGP